MVIVGSWGCMFYWCMFYVWENDVTKDEALKMALEALELHAEQYPHMQKGYTVDAITALRQALEQPEQELTGRQLQRMKQQAWKKIRAEDKDDPELCFALGFDAGYDAVARRVEPPEMESGGGFESRPASLEQPEQEPVAFASIEALAVERYKVVPSHDSMFYRHAVVAGDGKQQLYIGREVECENMARKFVCAFLDGAFFMQNEALEQTEQFFYGQDPNVLPAPDKGEINDK